MYGHPKLVKQWAKIMKPDATPAQEVLQCNKKN